jgi:hypothetical protein
MNINDIELRNKMREVLKSKTRNQIAEEIKQKRVSSTPFKYKIS